MKMHNNCSDQKCNEILPLKDQLMNLIILTNNYCWDDKFEKQDIDDWLSNFDGQALGDKEYEHQLALLLLCNFVYYNEHEIQLMCNHLLKKYIHVIKESFRVTSKSDIISQSFFIPLGNISESGEKIAYDFRTINGLPKDRFPDQIIDKDKFEKDLDDKNIKYIVFLDDVTISGTQANTYLDKYGFLDKYEKFFLTFLSAEQAPIKLKSRNINIISCNILDKRNKVLSEESFVFNIFGKHKNCLIEDATLLVKHYGIIANDKYSPLGYDNSENLLSFHFNTPDNTLPIFWGEDNHWKKLFKRYDKVYNMAGLDGREEDGLYE